MNSSKQKDKIPDKTPDKAQQPLYIDRTAHPLYLKDYNHLAYKEAQLADFDKDKQQGLSQKLEQERKEKLEELKKLSMAEGMKPWTIKLAKDGSCLGMVEIDDKEYKLAISHHVVHSLYMMRMELNMPGDQRRLKNDTPHPVFHALQETEKHPVQSYFVYFPHIEKYTLQHVKTAVSYFRDKIWCGELMRHQPKTMLCFGKSAEAKQKIEQCSDIENQQRKLLENKLQNFTQKKLKKAHPSSPGNWWQRYEGLSQPGDRLIVNLPHGLNQLQFPQYLALFFECLDSEISTRKILYHRYDKDNPQEYLFIGDDLPKTEKELRHHCSQLVKQYQAASKFADIWFVGLNWYSFSVLSNYIAAFVRYFPERMYEVIKDIKIYYFNNPAGEQFLSCRLEFKDNYDYINHLRQDALIQEHQRKGYSQKAIFLEDKYLHCCLFSVKHILEDFKDTGLSSKENEKALDMHIKAKVDSAFNTEFLNILQYIHGCCYTLQAQTPFDYRSLMNVLTQLPQEKIKDTMKKMQNPTPQAVAELRALLQSYGLFGPSNSQPSNPPKPAPPQPGPRGPGS